MTVDLAAGIATGWGTDHISEVEWVATGRYDDLISGDAGYNKLRGRAGDDVISGGGGNDLINGGADQDECRQGSTYLNCEVIR
jgi:Ca2+-binding RTX toxin-like protein